MFDIITKDEYWTWLDAGFCDPKSITLKAIQDAFILSRLQDLEGKRICEVGGGRSRILNRLAARNECWNVDALQGRGGGPTTPQEKCSYRLVRSYMGDFSRDIPDDYFDYVFSISVLEHIGMTQLDAFFRDCIRILKPVGTMYHAIDLYMLDNEEIRKRHAKNQEIHLARVRELFMDAEYGGKLAEPPSIDEKTVFSCRYATNSDETMWQWNKMFPALSGLRSVAQSVSIKVEWTKDESPLRKATERRKHTAEPAGPTAALPWRKSPFSRSIPPHDAETLIGEWVEKLRVPVTVETLYEWQRRIVALENSCIGRLAGDIQDALLRVLFARSVSTDEINMLEVGILFGVNAALTHQLIKDKFKKVNLVLVDPLNGYYGAGEPDCLTGLPVNRESAERNLATAAVPRADYEIIQGSSQDPAVISQASARRYHYMFIDGDHSYEGVKADFEHYGPFLTTDGILVFDNYRDGSSPGVDRFIDEIMRNDPRFDLLGTSWRTIVFRKREVWSGSHSEEARFRQLPEDGTSNATPRKKGSYPYVADLRALDDRGCLFEVSNPIESFRSEKFGGEEEFTRLILENIEESSVVFDIGACVGLVTVHAAKRANSVVSFEPDPYYRSRLLRNIALNSLENVRVAEWAVSNGTGTTTLYSDGEGGTSPSLGQTWRNDGITVATNSIDAAIASGELPVPTVVKMDIEGAEGLALQGMNSLLSSSRAPRWIYLEVHPLFLPLFGCTIEQLLEYLHAKGYRESYEHHRTNEIHYCFEKQCPSAPTAFELTPLVISSSVDHEGAQQVIDATRAKALCSTGRWFARAKRFDDAIICFSKALATKISDVALICTVKLEMGICHTARGSMSEAKECFEGILSESSISDDQRCDTVLELGKVYLAAKEPDSALQIYKHALQWRNLSGDRRYKLWYNIGALHEDGGDFGEAVIAFGRAESQSKTESNDFKKARIRLRACEDQLGGTIRSKFSEFTKQIVLLTESGRHGEALQMYEDGKQPFQELPELMQLEQLIEKLKLKIGR